MPATCEQDGHPGPDWEGRQAHFREQKGEMPNREGNMGNLKEYIKS